MDTPTTIQCHATAITFWCLTEQNLDTATQARLVETARSYSALAFAYRDHLPAAIRTEYYEQVTENEGACLDAEAGAAIQSHAAAIVLLARGI